MAKPPVTTPANQIALFEDQLAAMAMETVKAEQTGAAFLSTKGGVLTYRNNSITDNKLACVILASPVEHLYYSERYDPTKVVGPKCFAIGAVATGLKPAPNVEAPEHTSCEGCAKNEWGSATNGGKGKACRETRRMLLIPADSIGTAAAVEAAEVAALRPPVTSLKNYASYVQTIAATLKRPPLAVVTEISVVPDAKTQFKVVFTMVKAIDDPEVIQALIKRAAVETKRAIETAGMVNEEPAETATAESNRF
jgi:hypothetical protein